MNVGVRGSQNSKKSEGTRYHTYLASGGGGGGGGGQLSYSLSVERVDR